MTDNVFSQVFYLLGVFCFVAMVIFMAIGDVLGFYSNWMLTAFIVACMIFLFLCALFLFRIGRVIKDD